MVDLLHINDNKLVLQRGDETLVSQGYAWFNAKQVHFDLDSSAQEPAIKRCRLAPQQVNNRYWMQCDQNAISPNEAGMRHAADLIWQHLSQLKQAFNLGELLLVVPSHYRAENLQLLLGVAKASGLQVSGLINKAVLCLSASNIADGDYTHHDVQLHQAVTSRLSVSDGMVKLGDVESVQDVGIHLMQETLLKGLQNSFIQSDRFDPLHDASTEQQLFDQLSEIAEQVASSGKANVVVEHHGKRHSTSIDAKEWHGLLTEFASRLVKKSSSHTLLDLNSAFGSAALAGLEDAGIKAVSGLPNLDIHALLNSGAESATSAVVYRTELPLQAVELAPPVSHATPAARTQGDSSVTHLLSAGVAVDVNQAHVSMHDNTLSVAVNSDSNLAALLSNGQLFIMNDEGRTQLKPNDRLGSHLADGVITVIQVIA